MLKPKKRLRKREIKRDKLVEMYFKVYDTAYNRRRSIMTVAVAIVLVSLGVVVYMNNMKGEEERATAELGKVYQLYDREEYELAINGIPERNIPGLIEIKENFRRTEAGRLATFYLANSYYHLGDYVNAYEYFNRYRGRDPLLRASAKGGIAAIHEINEEYEEAAKMFERAALRGGDTPLTPEFLMHAGRNYLEAGMPQEALKILEKILEKYPDIPDAGKVDMYIAQAKIALNR